jgi:transposase-like protein
MCRAERKGGSVWCVGCGSEQWRKAGRDGQGRQRHARSRCGPRQTDRSLSAFAGYCFPDASIDLAVRWHLSYRLPDADVAELFAERGVHVAPSSVLDWVQRFTPHYQDAARPHRHRVRGAWSIDETSVKVAGVPCSVFRAIDDLGQVIDVYVSPSRVIAASTPF